MNDAEEEAAFLARIEEARREGRPLRVLITGARSWSAIEPIRRELASLPSGAIIIILIHGYARGADRLAHEIADELKLEIRPCPADWERYGKAAGIIRNRRMLEEDKPDIVIAFHPNLAAARGTKHMVEIARKANVPVKVIPE